MRKKYKCIEKDCKNEVSGKNRRCRHHALILRHKLTNFALKHGRYSKNFKPIYYCIDGCGAKVSEEGNRCYSCSKLGNKNPQFIDGRTNKVYYCLVKGCNTIVKSYGKKCRHHAQSGRKVSDKTKKKQSISMKKAGFTHNKEICSCFICKAYRGETKGENASNWMDGRSFEDYPKEFNAELRDKIRKRDDYICQNCGMTEEEHIIVLGYNLTIHHIDYNKNNNKESNLITTCSSCNCRANYNRNYWKEYYQKKMEKKCIQQ
jgi:hypothetical protein